MDLKVLLERLEIKYCNICERTYKNNAEYTKHILSHANNAYVKLTKQKIYKCNSCNAGFINEDDFKLHKIHHIMVNVKRKHMQIDSNRKHYYTSNINGDLVRNFECPDCGRKFVQENTLRIHSQIHEPCPFICFCGISYYSEFDFNKHQSLVHFETTVVKKNKSKKTENKVIYKDDFEEDIFDDRTSEKSENPYDDYEYGKKAPCKNKKNNLKKKTPKVKLKSNSIKCEAHEMVDCNICGIKVKAARLNKSQNKHSEVIQKCTICNRNFKQKGMFDNHMFAHERSKCSYCGKQFKNIYSKALHERIHTGERPYSCKFCSKPFGDPSALLRHTRTHTKDYRYFCDLCPKKFTDKSGLIGHKLRHEKRKIKCDICNKLFFTKHDLGKHFDIHVGRKNFECDHCGKKFTLKSYLAIHMKSKCYERNLFKKVTEEKVKE